MSDESSVNLIISTFLGERRLFMDNIRLSNPSIRIIYVTYDVDQSAARAYICDIALWLGQYHDIALWSH